MEVEQGVISWLLEPNNPPVRFLTLTNLLKKADDGPEVIDTREHLMDYGVTERILDHVDQLVSDQEFSKNYWKYTSKYWQLVFLGQLMVDGRDPRIEKLAKNILHERKWIIKSGAQCLTANILRAMQRLGYADHPVVQQEIEALAQRIIKEKGVECTAMNYSLLSHCFMAQPKILLCFAEIPKTQRSETVNSAIELMVNSLLDHEVYFYQSSHRSQWRKVLDKAPKSKDLPSGETVKEWIFLQRNDFLSTRGFGEPVPKKGWVKFGFPLHYNSDILEAMYALALLDIPLSGQLERPLNIIKNKMGRDGSWLLDNSLNGKMWVDIEEKGKPSKWITYFSLFVLNHYGWSKNGLKSI